MYSLNKKILDLENKIRILEARIQDLTTNSQEKSPTPLTKVSTAKGQGWWFIEGKWCTYAIYAD